MAGRIDEATYDLEWKAKDRVQPILRIGQLTLPTLQRLYQKYFHDKSVRRCDDVALLVRKLQYFFQYHWSRIHKRELTVKLQEKCREVIKLPLFPGHIAPSQEGSSMPKNKKDAKVKEKVKAKAEPVEAEEEEEETDDAEDILDEEEEEEDEDDDDDDNEDIPDVEDEADETEKTKAPRKPPVRTGVPRNFKLKGHKFSAKFIYEAMVAIFAINKKLKATNAEIHEAIVKTWPEAKFEPYRVNADRKKYNAGAFQNQKEKPEFSSKEYDEEGNVVKREIPEHLKKFVKPGQPVSQTIAENRKKGLIAKKSKKEKAA